MKLGYRKNCCRKSKFSKPEEPLERRGRALEPDSMDVEMETEFLPKGRVSLSEYFVTYTFKLALSIFDKTQ
ncbi:hypothetical protein ACROYT_G040155 [Oculina patagonica]